MKPIHASLILLALLLAAPGCSMREIKKNYDDTRNWLFDTKPTAQPTHIEDDTPIIELNYEAADELEDNLFLTADKRSPVWFTDFTNLEDPADTAPFGRVVTEQVVAGLIEENLNMVAGPVDLSAHPDPALVAAREKAERLERERALKARQASAEGGDGQAAAGETEDREPMEVEPEKPMLPYMPSMLTGTYLLGNDIIYLSARITTIAGRRMISAHQWTLPINRNTRMLLPQLLRPQRGMAPTVKTRF